MTELIVTKEKQKKTKEHNAQPNHSQIKANLGYWKEHKRITRYSIEFVKRIFELIEVKVRSKLP